METKKVQREEIVKVIKRCKLMHTVSARGGIPIQTLAISSEDTLHGESECQLPTSSRRTMNLRKAAPNLSIFFLTENAVPPVLHPSGLDYI
jgi:hypothetical protein